MSRNVLCGFILLGIWAGFAQAADPVSGAKLYQQHCRSCHGAQGQGQLPGVADFSRGEGLLKPDSTLMATIKSGRGMMPAYRGLLDDQQILDVIAHLRTLRRR